MEKTGIIGGGLVGSLLAILLAKRGFEVEVFEKRPDLRKEKIYAGRSINLALSERGWRALEMANVHESIRKIAIPMYGRMIHDMEGNTQFFAYGKENQAIYSVSRGELNKTLLEEAGKMANVSLNFHHRCHRVNLKQKTIEFENEQNELISKSFPQVFGTDGAFSEIRKQMQLTDRFDYSQTYLPDGYKELSIAANEDGSHKLDKNALHIWPRGRFMLIALPNLDGSFTCTLFFPFEGEVSFESLTTEEKLLQFFQSTFPDVVSLMPDLSSQYFQNPTSSLAIIRCFPWSYSDSFLLLGDAAHAIVPFYGQGMNCGFEDCRVLLELMDSVSSTDFKGLFKAFEKSRKPNGDAIAELALRNYIEMRDLVARPDFILRKKVEAKLTELLPDHWLPLYSMVTFSHIPYEQALKEGIRQDHIMESLMALPDFEQKWQDDTYLKEAVMPLLS